MTAVCHSELIGGCPVVGEFRILDLRLVSLWNVTKVQHSSLLSQVELALNAWSLWTVRFGGLRDALVCYRSDDHQTLLNHREKFMGNL